MKAHWPARPSEHRLPQIRKGKNPVRAVNRSNMHFRKTGATTCKAADTRLVRKATSGEEAEFIPDLAPSRSKVSSCKNGPKERSYVFTTSIAVGTTDCIGSPGPDG